MRKPLRSCGQIQLPKSWCREAGQRVATTHFQRMLGCIERESSNCSHDQNWRKSGMPLFGWWSAEVTEEALMCWRLRSQGLGLRKTPAQVVLLRSLSLCSENGLVRLVNGGEASKPQPGRFFWNSGTFSKHFQGSCRTPNVMCDYEVLSSTVRELERLHVGTQIGPKQAIRSSTSFLRQSRMGVRDTLAEQFGCKRFRRAKDNMGGRNPQPF